METMHADPLVTPAEAAPKPMDVRLLDEWQRDLPLVAQPFAAIAAALGVTEAAVIARLASLQASGVIARVGGVVRPNTLGASTLAALAAPELSVDEAALVLAAIPGINHVYLRENAWNLWFVVTGPDRAHIDRVLRGIEQRLGTRVLDLRLERAYHIDLGFEMFTDRRHPHAAGATADEPRSTADETDRALAQALTDGLPLVPRPFAEVGARLSIPEEEVLARLAVLAATGIVPRIGVIVRHRALGWRSNAMVVWDIAPEETDRVGARLAEVPGINLCYQRTRYAREWPYNLYCMVHARSREEAFATLTRATNHAGLAGVPRQILFSLRCFKQTGALLAKRSAA